jgi:maltooligosyltrehalose trehalohydrolase
MPSPEARLINDPSANVGAVHLGGNRCRFRVWAPHHESIEVVLAGRERRVLPMAPVPRGYHEVVADDIAPGTRYVYRIGEGRELPDPASRSQPEGVHAPSEVIATDGFEWTDGNWFGVPLRDYVMYELHVGTYTPAGTFDGIIPHLHALRELGITALELMPVAQFSGDRNWGYDGVYPFAVQNSYGGPAGLKRLVNAAHAAGLAVVLDVVYNHLGPEGNYLGDYGPYFTDRYQTAWGSALNFDGAHSDEVRRYFIANALHWQTHFHIDALRLDAVHAIHDSSAVTFLEELAETVRLQSDRLNRRFYLIAESDLNNARLILPRTAGGYGLDAQWSDDFHHSLHVLLTGETHGYYSDFGGTEFLAQVLRDGYAYVNKFSPHRGRRHGNSPRLAHTKQFVVCSRNHDQVGNRAHGERFSQLVTYEGLKLAAASVLLSPFIPLLFMGEEYAEEAPFQYFTSHGDPALAEAVRKGRREEFPEFHAEQQVPDPQDPATFQRSKLNHALRQQDGHRVIAEFYREALRLRRELPPIAMAEKETMHVIDVPHHQTVCVHYWTEDEDVFVILCFAPAPGTVNLPVPAGTWQTRLNSADERWNGPGRAIPAEITSNGHVPVELSGTCCVVLHLTVSAAAQVKPQARRS